MTAPFERDHLGCVRIPHPTRLVKTGPRAGLPFIDTYGRPSSFGKQIENSFNLTKWGERMEALGLGLSLVEVLDGGGVALRDERDLPPLLRRLYLLGSAPLDERESDAWKQEADSLVADAKNAAKAWAAAEQGTHGHEITEDDDDDRDWLERAEAGEVLGVPIEAQRAMIAAWRKMIAGERLEVLGIEVPVVHDAWRQAGTLDRWTAGPTGEFVVAGVDLNECDCPACSSAPGRPWHGVLDLKTGKMRANRNRIEYWQSYAIQVAVYATANAIWDGSARREIPWPICQRWALIAHLPVAAAVEGEARCELVLVDIAAGAQAAELCLAAKAWEKDPSTFARGPVYTAEAAISPSVVAAEEDEANELLEAMSEGRPPRLLTPVASASPSSRGEAAPAPRGLIAAALASTSAVSCPPEGAAPTVREPAAPPVNSEASDSVGGPFDSAIAPPAPAFDTAHSYKVVGLTFVHGYPANVHRLAALLEHPSRSERVDVTLARNPDNEHDANAVEVHVPALDIMLGHLDRATAAKVAPQLDAGKAFAAWVDAVLVEPSNPDNPGVRITLKALTAQEVAELVEGPNATDLEQRSFAARFQRLGDAARSWIKTLAEQGNAAGHSFSVSVRPSVRRLAIGWALVVLAEEQNDDDDVLRLLLAVVLGDEQQASVPLGAVLGALTIDQAQSLANLADAMTGTERTLRLGWTDDGQTMQLIGPALAAV